MLRELAPDCLWIADMPAQRGGLEFGARMTVVRLADGGLFLHSPVELKPDLREALDRLGPVRCAVAPSRVHYLHVGEVARAHPEARVYVGAALKERLQGVPVHGILDDRPPPEWAGTLEQALFRGSALYDEVDFYHAASRTLILTDLLFNIPPDRGWWTSLVARGLGILAKPSCSRTFRLFMRDRKTVRACLERILAWDFDRLLLTHGNIVETGGKAAFREAFARFPDQS